MTTWTSDELNKIGTAEELQIASLRSDGTLRNLVTIWVVRLGDDLYVRSVNGRTSAWFRGVLRATKDIFRLAASKKMSPLWRKSAPDIHDQIDAAYRTKYRHYAASIIDHCVSPQARSATIKLVPRSTGS